MVSGVSQLLTKLVEYWIMFLWKVSLFKNRSIWIVLGVFLLVVLGVASTYRRNMLLSKYRVGLTHDEGFDMIADQGEENINELVDEEKSKSPESELLDPTGYLLYDSSKLSLKVYYHKDNLNEGKVIEDGNTIHVEGDRGQSVTVFTKGENESLLNAIQRDVLAGYSTETCVVTRAVDMPGRFYINDTKREYLDDPANCPVEFTEGNGASYFVEDPNDSRRYFHFDIGQYYADWKVESY